MKLYTEQQVKQFLKERTFIREDTIDAMCDTLIPIELPSDEEIEESETNSEYDRIDEYNYGFIDGANWVKDFIINQNK
jgi:hypothetical protein